MADDNQKDDEQWMRQAIDLAKCEKGTNPEDTPIAAIVVLNGKIVATGVNRTAEDHDATAHAEIVALRAAGQAVSDMKIEGATLYSTLQPCGMCTFASIWAGVTRIVHGAGRDDVHEMYFEDQHLSTMDYISDAYKRDLVMKGGVLSGECAKLYFGPDDDVPDEMKANT